MDLTVILKKTTTSMPESFDAGAGGQSPKVGASKFDQIRAQLDGNSAVTPTATSASPEKVSLDKAQQNTAVMTQGRLRDELVVGQHHLARLKESVGAINPTASTRGIEGSLTSIEQQYTRLDSTLKTIPTDASPQQLMALQQQVYSMNESISTLSKMVGQVTSGVKTILQTQV